jgi:hypothetical protein
MRSDIDALSFERSMTESQARIFRLLMREVAYRRMQALRIYEPRPNQVAFHKSFAPERLAIGSNRSAKTTACAVEVAWAVTGTHPYLPYPKENGRFICVAKDSIKIGEVMYYKLFRQGALKMVKDDFNGIYRAWRPWVDGYDRTNLKNALPLIPPQMVKSIAWEKKNLHCPKLVALTNGWEILFCSSLGKPPNGVDIDASWFDEEIYDNDWYPEISARLLDRSGRFMWSATPQAGTDQLWSLHEQAGLESGKPHPRIEEFHFLLDDNPYIAPADIALFKAKASADPDEYRVRVLGEFLITSHRVYPNFGAQHLCEKFRVPDHWCRYIVVDPGYTNAVALFFAVPPKNESGHIYVYDELYTNQCDVRDFAKLLYPKTVGQGFEAFLIDRHGAQRTEMGGKSVGMQYAEAFAEKGIRSISTGSNFIMIGTMAITKSVIGEVSQVRSWLWNRDELKGKPILQIFGSLCPKFIEEMRRYRNKTVAGRITDTPDPRAYSHGPDCLRYAVIHSLPYVEPRKPKGPKSWVLKRLEEKRRKKREADGNYILLGTNRR